MLGIREQNLNYVAITLILFILYIAILDKWKTWFCLFLAGDLSRHEKQEY